MTALDERLGDLFGEDGFDLATRLAGAATDVTGIALPAAGLELGDLSGGLEGIADLDVDRVLAAVGSASGSASGALARVPGAGDLLGPLTAVVGPVRLLLDPGTRGLADGIATAGSGTTPATGLAALVGGAGRVQAALADPGTAQTLDALSALVPGLSVSGLLDQLRGPAQGVAALVRLLGALMAVESAVRELDALGAGVAGLLDDEQSAAAAARVVTLAGGRPLAEALAAADPDDQVEAERLASLARELRVVVEGVADLLRTGLGFGEAALVAVDVPSLAARLRAGTEGAAETDVPLVADLARTLSGWLAPVLALDVPVRAPTLDDFWDLVDGVVAQLAGALDDLDPTTLLDPLTAQLREGIGLLGEVESRAHEVVAVVHGALDTVVEAATALDVTPITDAVHLVLDPVAQSVRAVEDAVRLAEQAVRDVATTVTTEMGNVERHVGGAAGDVTAAFERVRAAVAELRLATLGDQLREGLDPIAAALQSAELSPYFDTAVDVMHTTADIVAAVPVDLLPDDVEADLREVVAPVKAIDFDAAVVTPLRGQLDEIRAGVDVAMLAALVEIQQRVVAFLREVDPEPALLEFEAEVFDPFLTQARALDPAEALAPVHDLLAEASAALERIDLRSLVAPVDDVFDTVLQALDQIDPEALLGDALAEVTGTVTGLREALALDTWRARVDAADAGAEGLAAHLDLAPVVALLGALWDDLVAQVRDPGPNRPSGLGTLVAGLLQSTPLVVRPEAFETVRRWVGGAVDAADDVAGRVGGAAEAFRGALDAAQRLDPVPLVGGLTSAYDAVTAAATALPEDSVVRRRVLDELTGADPREAVGPLVAARDRYLARLGDAAALVDGLEHAGRSELAAVSRGLRDALRPLAVLPQRLRDLIAALGVDVGTDLRAAVADLLEGSPPERVLAPLSAVADGLRAALLRAVREGVLGPMRTALDDVDGVLDALDLSFVVAELQTAYDAARATVEALRPSTLLEPVLAELDDLVQLVHDLDPLSSVEPVLRLMRDAVTRVAELFRPTVVAKPALDAYDEVVAAVAAVDVAHVLEPVLAALDSIAAQLDDGLERAGSALTELQEALP